MKNLTCLCLLILSFSLTACTHIQPEAPRIVRLEVPTALTTCAAMPANPCAASAKAAPVAQSILPGKDVRQKTDDFLGELGAKVTQPAPVMGPVQPAPLVADPAACYEKDRRRWEALLMNALGDCRSKMASVRGLLDKQATPPEPPAN